MCADHARFALPEVTRGRVAAGGGLVQLPRLVGPRRALQLILTGAPIDAATALEWGLVNQVVRRRRAAATTMTLARTIAANAPVALRVSKRTVLAAVSDTDEDAARLNEDAFAAVLRSPDSGEGLRAFAEGRAPVWTDLRVSRPALGGSADVEVRTGASSGRASSAACAALAPSPSTGAAVVTNLSASRSALSGRSGLPERSGTSTAAPLPVGQLDLHPRAAPGREAAVDLAVDGQLHARHQALDDGVARRGLGEHAVGSEHESRRDQMPDAEPSFGVRAGGGDAGGGDRGGVGVDDDASTSSARTPPARSSSAPSMAAKVWPQQGYGLTVTRSTTRGASSVDRLARQSVVVPVAAANPAGASSTSAAPVTPPRAAATATTPDWAAAPACSGLPAASLRNVCCTPPAVVAASDSACARRAGVEVEQVARGRGGRDRTGRAGGVPVAVVRRSQVCGQAAADLVADDDRAQQPTEGGVALVGHREGRGDDGRARVEEPRRVDVVELEHVRRRTVHQRGQRRRGPQASSDDATGAGPGLEAVEQRGDDGLVEPPRVAASQSTKALRAAACTEPSRAPRAQLHGPLGEGADHGRASRRRARPR